jgi:hypothetical protein
MMIADRGDILKVAGKRIDIAPTGPIPGRTPTSVPIKTPRKQYAIFVGSSPIEKPYKRLVKTSINLLFLNPN